MEIEPAATDEVDRLADQWVSLADEQVQYGSHVRGEANRGRIRDEIARHAATDRVLVARSDAGDILGFAMFTRERESYEKTANRGIVEALYVVPERRGEGIGSALLAAAERQLFDAGVDRIALEALAANDAARRFYRRHGYETHRVELEKATRSDNHSKEGGQ